MDLIGKCVIDQIRELLPHLATQTLRDRVETINTIRQELHKFSPFAEEPVDCVLWVPADQIQANDYNPNSVAPPEMKLLEHSITEDGYTQPIVAWQRENVYEVVDGFHRNRVGRESKSVRERVLGHLPITVINPHREDRGDRIAATIRHNRARGKHQVSAMSDIVIELKRRNWSDEKIGRELGMDPDEVLRLCQISGLAEMFADRDFSEAWEHTGSTEDPVGVADDDDLDSSKSVDLEWLKEASRSIRAPGWHDRTENSSILYGEKGQQLALISKSRFREEWFVYVYLQPIQELRAPTLSEGKNIVEGLLAIK